jgi:predicted CoA-substrate-specific enzyme activase
MDLQYSIGIDSGSQNTKAVLLQDRKIIGTASVSTEFDALEAAGKVFSELLSTYAVERSQVARITATGTGRSLVSFADATVNEIISAAAGSRFMVSDADMVLDMGAEASRVIAMDEDGMAKTYEINDRCASGAGTFIETVARALQIVPDQMGDYALQADKDIMLKAQCVVFVESEVISLIHQKETRENIANGVHNGISNRLCSMFRRLGIGDKIVFIGGPSLNKGLVKSLSHELDRQVIVPDYSPYLSAVGAVLTSEKAVFPK